jgi:hypothetical protein
VKFDALAKQFFKNAEGFARAIKLLSEHDDAWSAAATLDEFQKDFLDRLDDVTDKETRSRTFSSSISFACFGSDNTGDFHLFGFSRHSKTISTRAG